MPNRVISRGGFVGTPLQPCYSGGALFEKLATSDSITIVV
jgi:hypothetical protein